MLKVWPWGTKSQCQNLEYLKEKKIREKHAHLLVLDSAGSATVFLVIVGDLAVISTDKLDFFRLVWNKIFNFSLHKFEAHGKIVDAGARNEESYDSRRAGCGADVHKETTQNEICSKIYYTCILRVELFDHALLRKLCKYHFQHLWKRSPVCSQTGMMRMRCYLI